MKSGYIISIETVEKTSDLTNEAWTDMGSLILRDLVFDLRLRREA